MDIATLVRLLDDPRQAADLLPGWRIADTNQVPQMIAELAEAGLPLDLLAALCEQLERHLSNVLKADEAVADLRDFLLASRSPLALAALLVRDSSAIPQLLSALAIGPTWKMRLLADPEAFDFLRQTAGQPIAREQVAAELAAEVSAFGEERSITDALHWLWWRHLLRIAYGETALRHRYELVSQQLTQLYEALLEAAWQAAERIVLETRPRPDTLHSPAPRACLLCLGRLGSGDPGYFPTLDLLVVYEPLPGDAADQRAQADHFDRKARLLVRLLAGDDDSWPRVPIRLLPLPETEPPRAAHTADDVVLGFHSFGRTWHREQLLAARPVAGDKPLGDALVHRLEPWLFRRYLTRPDETGVKALKRRILIAATVHQDDWNDVQLATGGLRDMQATIRLLQLLVGGEHSEARSRGMLDAIAGLERAGAISVEDRMLLDESFVALRRIEHRLQLARGTAASQLPASDEGAAQLAAALGSDLPGEAFVSAYRQRLERTWQTLKRLLEAAFPEEAAAQREVELLLDPEPHPEEVRAALAPFGFAHPEAALADLHELSTEPVPYLSTRRCRHFLSLILPKLLVAIGATPDPDRTLSSLLDVSNSLGGKAALFELFLANSPSLELYVKLCAGSPYLSGILMTNPGMIDELADSLQHDRLPTRAELEATLVEMTRGREDVLLALYDFKNAWHLRIGVRDILGKEDIDRTHRALADVAEICLEHVVRHEYARLLDKHGLPRSGAGPQEGEACQLVIVGLGKLGGREPNYHSELEVAFLYEAEGFTQTPSRSGRSQRTTNSHFFTQLAQRVMKQLAQLTPKGRLYSIEALLRPVGLGGVVSMSLSDFEQHFASGAAPLWEWQALTQARPVFGEARALANTQQLIRRLLAERPWQSADRDELRRSRLESEAGASERNLKRGRGGTRDIECLVQMNQLRAAHDRPDLLLQNTQDALAALTEAGVLDRRSGEALGDNYRFLRRVESGLRLLNTSARHELPSGDLELRQLALVLGHSNATRLAEQCLAIMAANRELFERLTG